MTHTERVLDLLSDGEPHSHHELYALHVMGHSRVADLRKKGYTIECWRDGENYMYQLGGLSEPECSQGPESGSESPPYGHAGDLMAILAREDMRRQVEAEQLALEVTA